MKPASKQRPPQATPQVPTPRLNDIAAELHRLQALLRVVVIGLEAMPPGTRAETLSCDLTARDMAALADMALEHVRGLARSVDAAVNPATEGRKG